MSEKIEDKEYFDLLNRIYALNGYDFTNYAVTSVRRRINHFMELKGIDTCAELTLQLESNESMFAEFLQSMSITVTEMFRDPTFYKAMRQKILMRLATYPRLKIWVAGCATGEEAYSVAIVLKEEGLLHRAMIYATDINPKSLRIARQGIYPMDTLTAYAHNYTASGGHSALSEHYKVMNNAYMFNDSLKQHILFASHNLVTDQSFNEFQLILCRNVLLYFNNRLQNNVMSLFY